MAIPAAGRRRWFPGAVGMFTEVAIILCNEAIELTDVITNMRDEGFVTHFKDLLNAFSS
jgi:hypothetical protein|tara:strand:+ start:263 stop:439 length:177 start_codon:yes stop_codon:yes gene_type:complete